MAEYLSDLVDACRWQFGDGFICIRDDELDPKLMIKVNGMVVEVEEIEARWNGEIILKTRGD